MPTDPGTRSTTISSISANGRHRNCPRARRCSGGELVTHVAFSHYNAIQAIKTGMERAGSTVGDAVSAALVGAEIAIAAGLIVLGAGRYAAIPRDIARGTRQGL